MIRLKNSQIGFALAGLFAIPALFTPLAYNHGAVVYPAGINLGASLFFLCSALCMIAMAVIRPNFIFIAASVIMFSECRDILINGARTQLLDFQWGISASLMFTATAIGVASIFFKAFEAFAEGKNKTHHNDSV